MGPLTHEAEHRRHDIRVEEDAGALRRAVATIAGMLPALRPGDAELAATELATNILRHTQAGGYVLCRRAGEGLELLAVDHGPGMRPGGVPAWAAPGGGEPAAPPPFTGGGLGVGLAGVRRLASVFDCYSAPGGTAILARLGPVAPAGGSAWRWGGVNVPFGGAGDSGDAWAVSVRDRLGAVVVDGLGHGPAAAKASRAAVAAFEHWHLTDLDGFVTRAHEAMRGTRGGVIGVCLIEPRLEELSFAGVGNITGRVIIGGKSQSLLGRSGTVGTHLQPPRPHPTTHRWARGATLVLASDGISSRWDPLAYPGLLRRDPAVVAATLQRDHGRSNDDATVLVVQDTRGHDIPGGD